MSLTSYRAAPPRVKGLGSIIAPIGRGIGGLAGLAATYSSTP